MTQYEKIIALMIRQKKNKDWFFVKDFMQTGLGDLFVGYEAGSRMAELGKKFPAMIESKPDGRLKQYRFRFENVEELLKVVPQNLSTLIVHELNEIGFIAVDKI